MLLLRMDVTERFDCVPLVYVVRTGTGFIKVENNGNTFNIGADSATDPSHVYKGNPATNDWIPSAVDEV
ncbi:hypothetical protein MTR67_025483 [Solanum verrucosum]|uniref:Uncharacterized protein n=1 Tax=Solanum verrucosum TaxID=315347 RepID=A0AAF0QZV1_SOLVR|nr:hypothetical protein MTR67_025483 [Solanum verrucosum]